jgi:hypothetical protein
MIVDNGVQMSEQVVSIDIEIEAGDIAPAKAHFRR